MKNKKIKQDIRAWGLPYWLSVNLAVIFLFRVPPFVRHLAPRRFGDACWDHVHDFMANKRMAEYVQAQREVALPKQNA